MFNAIEFLAQANQYAPQTMMHFKIQCFYTTGMWLKETLSFTRPCS